jgi:hypothetical protein
MQSRAALRECMSTYEGLRSPDPILGSAEFAAFTREFQMKNEKLSTNLLAAGLFGVAQGVDAIKGDLHTLRELFRFCVMALEEQGEDPMEIISELKNSHDYAKSIERATFIMGAIDEQTECLAELDATDYEACALHLGALVRLQFSANDRLRREFLRTVERSSVHGNKVKSH